FVSSSSGEAPPRLSRGSSAVIASFLHTAKAYEIVASTKTLTFTLDVYSDPKGAKISYGQQGGSYQPLYHETDWKIENLPRAGYLILLQKEGYRDEVITFDAMDNTRTSVTVTLKRERDRR